MAKQRLVLGGGGETIATAPQGHLAWGAKGQEGWGSLPGLVKEDGGRHLGFELAVGAALAGGGVGAAALTAAAAAVHEGLAQGTTETQEQDRRHRALEEQEELIDKVEQIQGLLGHVGGHVGHHEVADILGGGAEPVDDGQSDDGAVQVTLALAVLAAPALALLVGAADAPGHQLAADGEQDGQAEVAAKVPPHASVLVGEHQGIDGFGQVGRGLHGAVLGHHTGHGRRVLRQLPEQDLRHRERHGAHPDDSQLGNDGLALLDGPGAGLGAGGCVEPVDAQGTETEGGDSQRRYLVREEAEQVGPAAGTSQGGWLYQAHGKPLAT